MYNNLWENVLQSLSQSVETHRFETWIKPLLLHEQSDPTLLSLSAPNQYMVDFLSQHFSSLILSAARSFSPDIKTVSIVPRPSSSAVEMTPVIHEPMAVHRDLPPQPAINSRYIFDSFVVGSGNEFAKSAALAVAQAPGKTKFNPLLIYGGVGLGKTHLIQAIGNHVATQNTDSKVNYITSEEFYLSFIDAIKNNNIKKFTDRFRSSDLLLMDDVQFFSGKESTQEEFFFIFNTLHQNGKQIVLTSDLPPSSLKGLQDRLISRFQWGLTVDIQPPNLETRVAILKKKAEEGNLNIPQNVLYHIAETVSSNVRQLEGVVLRLLAYSSIMKNDITIDLVRDVLRGTAKKEKSRISIDNVIEKVSEYFSIPADNIREKNRRKEVAHARQVAMYIAKTVTPFSLKTIGLGFGGRDHSTVIHSVTQIEEMKKTDISLSRDIEFIINKVESL